MPLKEKIPHVSLFLVMLMVSWLVAISGQPRMADGQLEFSEANIMEIVFGMTAVASVFATWILAVSRAMSRGHGWWAIGVVCFWPLSYPYLLSKK